MIKDNEQAGEGACTKKTMRRLGGRGKKQKIRRYPPEFRRRAVMMCVEGGHSQWKVARQLDVPLTTLSNWVVAYKRDGDGAALLRSSPPPAGGGDERPRLPEPVREKIVELKQANGRWGVRRIAQVMYRWFLMKVSPESVRRTLHKENLIEPVVRRPKRNPGKPRFFERATPNQMWQSDIFCFRLGGATAYLIAFMDDYSRFIVGLELFRSQTAQSVLEVYRRAVGEYGTPKEMLTDNGRQYATWRGKTRFQLELAKDRIAHIRSQPHHPMTLGKVERFWSSIWGEFLGRAQFDDFEQARARIRLWVQYYNHKRPHQGLGGLCPADRYFEIQTELRKTLEQGIRDNVLEMALRGRPNAPFYMVGRMHGQSVVLHAEKGKLKLRVDDDNLTTNQELEYDIQTENSSGYPGSGPDEQIQTGQIPVQAATDPSPREGLQRPTESPGGAGCLDRETQPDGDLPPDGGQLHDLPELAEPCHGGHAPGAGEPSPDQRHDGPQPAPAQIDGPWPPGGAPRPQAAENTTTRTRQPACGLIEELCEEEIRRLAAPTGGGHPAGPLGPDYGDRGGRPAGDLPQELLSMGGAGLAGDACGPDGWQSGTPAGPAAERSGEPPPEEAGGGTGGPPQNDGGGSRTACDDGGPPPAQPPAIGATTNQTETHNATPGT
jgi:transposase InsO family protein